MSVDWGYVNVSNKSGYVGTFLVTCDVEEVTLKFDWGGGFPADQSRTTRIPGSATNISIDFHCYVIAHHTRHIATETFTDISSWNNGSISYEMTGATVDPHVHQTS
ncbi:MAG TPA: hypothetical protein VHG35_16515 [Gemmatimonadales bacterium]|nr:hypothetical protein [Gemmatimonadales bacterium]